MDIFATAEYHSIHEHYGTRTARRSGVPLINHVNEGLEILDELESCMDTKKAFCIHPLTQNYEDLIKTYILPLNWSPRAILLAMEYRQKANAYLCRSENDGLTVEDLPKVVGKLLPEVRDMLIADKVQNKRDFMTYHYGTHPRSEELHIYFINWLRFLGSTLNET